VSGVGKTEAISVHKFRRVARHRERMLQQVLGERVYFAPVESVQTQDTPYGPLPLWARGVRVERIGPFCFAVIATEERGH
jgi:hypothetical protein